MPKLLKLTGLLMIMLLSIVACSTAGETEPASNQEAAEISVATATVKPTDAPTATSEPTIEPTQTPEPAPTATEVRMTQEEIDEAFIKALRKDTVDEIETLIAEGATINAVDRTTGYSPVTIATLRDNPETLNLLIAAGADITVVDRKDNTLLHHAAYSNSIDVASILLEEGKIDLELERELYGFTPLLVAAFEGNVEMVEMLITHGADIEAFDDWEDTPINVAAWNGKLAVVQKLVELGANPDHANTNGNTALSHSQSQGHEDIEAFLTAILEG